jgi:hypothetical protein
MPPKLGTWVHCHGHAHGHQIAAAGLTPGTPCPIYAYNSSAIVTGRESLRVCSYMYIQSKMRELDGKFVIGPLGRAKVFIVTIQNYTQRTKVILR